MMDFNVFNMQNKKQYFSRDNQFKLFYNGEYLNADDYVAARIAEDKNSTYSDLYKEFWQKRNDAVEESFATIFKSNKRKGTIPFEGFSKTISSGLYSTDADFTFKQINQWEMLSDITSKGGSGTIWAFDLETLGDIQHNGLKTNGAFDITEFSVSARHFYDDGRDVKNTAESYIIGVSKNNEGYYQSVINKFKNEGLESLSKDERVIAERLSMYRNSTIQQGTLFNSLKTVSNVSESTLSYEDMQKGLRVLTQAYQDPLSVIREITPSLQKATSDSKYNVLVGANSRFDITGIVNTLNTYNTQETKDLANIYQNSIQENVLDVVYSARALAAKENRTVDDYLMSKNGVKIGVTASVEGQMAAYQFNRKQTHYGAQDVINETDVAIIRSKELGDTSKKDITRYYNRRPQVDANQVLFFHSGSLNHETGLDFGTIKSNGKSRVATPNMSFSGEYWTVDNEHSGYREINGEDKFVATFTNYADMQNSNSPNSFTMVYDSEDDALEFISKHAFVTDEKSIIDPSSQQKFHYLDIGRRQFDRLLNPNDVVEDSKHNEINGFNSLQYYLGLKDKLQEGYEKLGGKKGLKIDWDNIQPDGESASKIFRLANELDSQLGYNFKMSYYDAQAYVGMYGRLSNEEGLLKDLVESINSDSRLENANNIEKTIALRNGYNNIINQLDSSYERDFTGSLLNVADTNALDLNIDNETRRIRFNTQQSASGDLNRLFNSLNYDGVVNQSAIKSILYDLHDREIIDDKKFRRYINKANNLTDARSVYGFSESLAMALMKDVSNSDKADKLLLRNYGNEYVSDAIKSFVGSTFSDAYSNSHIDVSKAIASESYISYSILGKAFNENNLNGLVSSLSRQLNVDDELNVPELIGDIFSAKGKYGLNNKLNRDALTTVLVRPNEDNASAYLLYTTKNDYAKLRSALDEGIFDFSSYQKLTNGPNSIFNYAGVEELPYIGKLTTGEIKDRYIHGDTEIGLGTVRTVKQGESFEKFIIPELTTYTDGDGNFKGYFNSAAYTLFSTHRVVGESALKEMREGNYTEGSKIFRKKRDSYLSDMAASNFYRVVRMPDGTMQRQVIPSSLGDLAQGFKMNLGELTKVFDRLVTDNAHTLASDNDLNTAQKVVKQFAHYIGVDTNFNGDYRALFNQVLHGQQQTEFGEFFRKQLFLGTISDSAIFKNEYGKPGLIAGEEFNHNLFDIIIKDANNAKMDPTIVTALSNIQDVLGKIDVHQVDTESATQKLIVSALPPMAMRPGLEATNIVRPTLNQGINSLPFDVSKISDDVRNQWGIVTGTNALGFSENAWRKLNFDNPENIETQFNANVKQLSQWELDQLYIDAEKNADYHAKQLGLSLDDYNKTLALFRQTYSSLYEDSSFIAPGLMNTELFKDREPMKVKFSPYNINVDETRSLLNNLDGQVVTRNTPIAVSDNGKLIYHSGADVLFDQALIKTLLPDDVTQTNIKDNISRIGLAYAEAAGVGDMPGKKWMIDGVEKTVGHSLNVDQLAEYTKKDLAVASQIANNMFYYFFDGAPLVANPSTASHANPIISATTKMNIITEEYAKAGKTDILAKYIQDNANNIKGFSGIQVFEENNRLIIDNYDIENYVAGIEDIYDNLSKGNILQENKDINNTIVQRINDLNKNNLINGTVHVQNVNEKLGTTQIIDQRIQQSIMMRSMDPNELGLNPDDIKLNDLMKDFARNYDDRSKQQMFDSELEGLNELVNIYMSNKDSQRIANARAGKDMTSSTQGLLMAIESYINPKAIDKYNKNYIADVDVKDLKKILNGVDSRSLDNTPFFVNGKPSQFLSQVMGSEEAAREVRAIRLNLGREISYKPSPKSLVTTVDSIIIPIQDLSSQKGENKIFFREFEQRTKQLLNTIRDISINPQGRSEIEIQEQIVSALNFYMKNSVAQIQMGNKKSDIYKALNSYIFPTSSQFQAIDESSPTFTLLAEDKELQKIVKEKYALEDILTERKLTTEEEDRYISLSDKLNAKIKSISERIKTDDDYFSKIRPTNISDAIYNGLTYTKKGKKYIGMGQTIGKEGFESLGLDFKVLGLDVLSNYERQIGLLDFQGNSLPEFKKFAKNNDLANSRQNIINLLQQQGYTIDSDRSVITQISEIIESIEGIRIDKNLENGFSTRAINKSIAKGNNGILGVLESIEKSELAETYLEQIGMFAQNLRYPVFDSQPISKVFLDRSIEGKGTRYLNNLFTDTTRVDFDGDSTFLSGLLLKGSVLHEEDELYQYTKKSWENFAENHYREMFADSILGGDIFKRQLGKDSVLQKSSYLDTMRDTTYMKQLAQEFIKSSANSNISSLTADELLADTKSAAYNLFMHSDIVNKAYDESIINALKDSQAQMAAIAARYRKLNIGFISTPNYSIRDSLIRSLNFAKTDDEISKITQVLHGVTNMQSLNGGIFSLFEQKGIDSKKASDLLNIAETAKYQIGMNEILVGLTKKGSASISLLEKGSRNIMTALGPNVFAGISGEQIDRYSKTFATTSWKDFDSLISNASDSDKKIFGMLKTLRGLAEISAESEGFSNLHGILKGKVKNQTMQNFFDLISQSNGDEFANTALEELFETFISNTLTGESQKSFGVGNVYVASGRPWGDNQFSNKTSFFVYNGGNSSNAFTLLDAFGRRTKHNFSYKEAAGLINVDIGRDVSLGEFQVDPVVRNILLDKSVDARVETVLNRLTIRSDGNIRKGFANNLNLQSFNGNKDQFVRTLMGFDSNDLKGIESTLNQTGKIIMAYNTAISSNYLDKRYTQEGAELLRSINRNIASNRRTLEANPDVTYADIVHNEVSKIFGGADKLNEYIDSMSGMSSSFDIKKYNQDIKILNDSIIDINQASKSLENSFSNLQLEIDTMREYNIGDLEKTVLNPLQQRLDNKNTIINDALSTISKQNSQAIRTAQNSIYSQFTGSNIEKQILGTFKLNVVNGTSTVGFGTYMGKSFSSLGFDDVEAIKKEAVSALNNIGTEYAQQEKLAINLTLNALDKYNFAKTSKVSFSNTSEEIVNIINANTEMVTKGWQDLNTIPNIEKIKQDVAPQKTVKDALKESKTIGTAWSTITETLSKHKKGVVGAVGALFALGVANNLLHKDNNKSPLTPAQSNNHPDRSPNYNNKTVQAPASTGQKTLYMDEQSGLQFRITGKNRSKLDNLSNAQLVSQHMNNGGNVNLTVTNDMSSVNNNWLENKFAQLIY